MMYQNPRIAETEMADGYLTLEDYRRFPDQDQAKSELFRSRIDRIRRARQLAETGMFLDYGAARGVMLDSVRQCLPGWITRAVELSPSARARLEDRGYDAVVGAEDLDPALQYDWINIDNVLEHLPDPVGTLVKLRPLVARRGFIYVEVPNESFFAFRYRMNDWVRGCSKLPTAEGHINLFTPRTLRRTFLKAGYSCEQLGLESVSVPHRLKGALGADETPRLRAVLRFLRVSRLDVALRLAYFICAIIRVPE